MDKEHIIDGLQVIQRKRGRNVDQGDVEMLELAIKALSALPEAMPSDVAELVRNVRILAEGSDWKRDQGETLAEWIWRTRSQPQVER